LLPAEYGGKSPSDHETASLDLTNLSRGTLYCREYIYSYIVIHMKTMIDLDEEALALAAKELGTTTKKDTVNAALEFVAGRRRRIEQLLDDPYAFGVGPDITDPEIMRTARR
jgi:Arc/MetJ family transcription regulator